MGWDFGPETRSQLVARLRQGAIASRLVGNRLWAVERGPSDTPIICCYLLATKKGRAGYKDLTESMEPYYYDCPLALLDLAPVAHESWRDKVRVYHLENKQKRARRKHVKCGDTVELTKEYGSLRLVVTSTKPLLGTGVETGKTYRIGPRHIAAVISAEPT
jgi:hypothetical protein